MTVACCAVIYVSRRVLPQQLQQCPSHMGVQLGCERDQAGQRSCEASIVVNRDLQSWDGERSFSKSGSTGKHSVALLRAGVPAHAHAAARVANGGPAHGAAATDAWEGGSVSPRWKRNRLACRNRCCHQGPWAQPPGRPSAPDRRQEGRAVCFGFSKIYFFQQGVSSQPHGEAGSASLHSWCPLRRQQAGQGRAQQAQHVLRPF